MTSVREAEHDPWVYEEIDAPVSSLHQRSFTTSIAGTILLVLALVYILPASFIAQRALVLLGVTILSHQHTTFFYPLALASGSVAVVTLLPLFLLAIAAFGVLNAHRWARVMAIITLVFTQFAGAVVLWGYYFLSTRPTFHFISNNYFSPELIQMLLIYLLITAPILGGLIWMIRSVLPKPQQPA